MKVKELLEQLNQFDKDLDILCYSEDGNLLAPGHSFRLLDIHGVSIVEGEKRRGDDIIPSLKIGKTPHSQKHVVIEVTADF
ncbi:MAG: hypothetical protein Q8N12_01395 [Thermodesulfovibrionales bacterium]|nr:hypothetical protein [Thermodesulfovibrionales bacterium]